MSRRRAPWSSVTLTPIRLPEGLLTLRSPRLTDGPAWSAARLANREWLERAFPAWGSDWAAEQSEVAWTQRWGRLRLSGMAGRSKSFVMTLDGALIGEIGIDAVDQVSGAGEAAVWMVRSHGSPAVMNVASLLLIEHSFTGPHSLDRLISPVATSSRRGRAPGLEAVGFEIEGTVPRRVGAKGLVEHDMWVLHRSDQNLRTTIEALRPLRAATSPDAGTTAHLAALAARPPRALAATVSRSVIREVRGGAHRAWAALAPRGRDADRQVPIAGSEKSVTLRRASRVDLAAVGAGQSMWSFPGGSTRWAVESAGRVLALIAHRDDYGTATTEVFAVVRSDAARDAVATALASVLDELRPAADEPRVLVVRVPARSPAGTTLDADLLIGLGLERIATYRGDPHGSPRWGGEVLWRSPANS